MRSILVVPLLLCLVGFHAKGGDKMTIDKSVTEIETPFDKGKFELQSNSGAYLSVGHKNQPSIGYTSTAYRLGVMLNTPQGSGFFRGNCELALQLFGASVFQDDPGNYILGAAVLLRYNFVQPESKWVPYVQIGAGADYTDIYKDRTQSLIGQQWGINLEAAVGLRYFLTPRLSASIDGGYRHISNGGNADRNVGLNSLGGGVGLGYHF